MPHEILRTAQVATVLGGISAREKRSYEAAVDALRGEGCGAGGYRLAAADGDDYPLCCRHLAYAWRMFTAYPRKKQVVISTSAATTRQPISLRSCLASLEHG
jgi:hypothetical protein